MAVASRQVKCKGIKPIILAHRFYMADRDNLTHLRAGIRDSESIYQPLDIKFEPLFQ
jgi:hypothetical protein